MNDDERFQAQCDLELLECAASDLVFVKGAESAHREVQRIIAAVRAELAAPLDTNGRERPEGEK